MNPARRSQKAWATGSLRTAAAVETLRDLRAAMLVMMKPPLKETYFDVRTPAGLSSTGSSVRVGEGT
ncbi:hypothetical protein GCM10010166_47850 [Couchioplanes caeruleus subsp. azureus]|nr:hypothetical protein GCM10010166_47850 [Couchioplanes caeruleus subsp. azureus]